MPNKLQFNIFSMISNYKTIVVVFIFLSCLPFFIAVSTATEILIFGLYAMGFNILLGYTGVLSFGHATYFGLGAYIAGFILKYWFASAWLALLGSLVIPAITGLILGLLCIKRKGVYFAMLSAAFANMFYFLALSPLRNITGGEDGLKEIPVLMLQFPFRLSLNKPLNVYYFVFVLFVISIFIIWRIIQSPFGKVLKGIRENEERMKACGYNTKNIKIISLILSSLFSGLSGGLYVIYLNYVPLRTFHWLTSGRAVVMSLLGGMDTFIGPIVGAGIFLFLEDTVSIFTARWEMFVGSLVVLVILFSPGGVMGIFKKRIKNKNV
jgi:branched-chain amino acid transport system permease protein